MVAVGENCGYILPTQKAKIGKGAKPRSSAMKKNRCWRREFRQHNKITIGATSFGYFAPTLITLAY